MNNCHVIAITNQKGGVGKTNQSRKALRSSDFLSRGSSLSGNGIAECLRY